MMRFLWMLILQVILWTKDGVIAQKQEHEGYYAVTDICLNIETEAICVLCGCLWNDRQLMMFPLIHVHRCDCPWDGLI